MNEIRVWVDGALVDADAPAIRAIDHGVTVGDGAFETTKVVDGAAVALTRHLRRMDRSLAGLGLPGADHELIRAGIAAVLDGAPPWPLARLRWTVTGGPGPLGSDRATSALTTIVTLGPQAPVPASGSIVTVPWVRNERSATVGLKTTSYADNVLALAYAHDRGATEGIFANTRGELCEGSGSNVFVVLDGELWTPPLSSGCLAGIARELTLQWCREADVAVHEQALPIAALERCEEAFLTSSIKDVFPVHAVDGRELAAPGPMTARVAALVASRLAEGLDP